mgnify:FL=1
MFITFYKKFTDLFEKKISIFYILFLIFTILSSSFYTHFYLEKFDYQFNDNNELILNLIPFGYGQIIENLYYHNKFEQVWFGINTYLTRLPFVPLFITSLSKISLNVYFIIITKNIIFFSLIFYSIKITTVRYNKKFLSFLILFITFFYNFYNTIVLSTYIYADAYIASILPCIFLILLSDIKKKFLLISTLIFVLYFTKTSVFYLTIFISILFFILEKNLTTYKRILPVISLILAIMIWGTFGYIKTKKFPVGSNMLSNNQEALSIVMNKNFKDYYPKLSVDLIPRENINNKFKNEWEFSEYYKSKNKEYFLNNKLNVFKDINIKIKFIFFNYRKDAINTKIDTNNKNSIMISHIFNRIVFIISIIVLIKNIFEKKFQKPDIYYFAIIVSSLFPHVIGWATSKHLVPLFLVSHLYLFLRLNFFNKLTQ